MVDYITKAEECNNKAENLINGWGFSKFDDAAEFHHKAANSFKIAKSCKYFSTLLIFVGLFLLIMFIYLSLTVNCS